VVPVRPKQSNLIPPSKPLALKQMNSSINRPANAPKPSMNKPASKIPVASKLPRLQEHKKMAQKQPLVRSPAERRQEAKTYVKGVRTNKRFELLMEKRRQMQGHF